MLRTRPTAAFAVLVATVGLSSAASAKDFYVDPAGGADSGDGSQAKPWKTLAAVVSGGKIGTDVKAGDTVLLLSGHHGALAVSGGTYATPITVRATSGATPTLTKATFARTSGWVLDGVSISPSYATPAAKGDMVSIDGQSTKVVVKNCKLFTVTDASSWTADQWINASSSGISVRGNQNTVSHNELRNVRFGISVDGDDDLVEYNEIVNFSADGLRGLGDNGVFQYNVVKNAYVSDTDGDDNHDDGFQSWSVGPGGVGTGVVKGVVLRGNVIINREDPNQKLTNSLQGVGCFDGYFEDWVVENNIVITDHWHGISLYGARSSRIVNNTVIDVNATSPGPPWIMVTKHKDGTPSENVIVRNNLATDYDVSGTNVTDDHNTTLKTADLAKYFVDPAKFDLHLLPGAPAVNAGVADGAPKADRDRITRPQGTAIDLGAYEWHDDSVTPPDGGVDPGGSGGTTASGGQTSSGGAGSPLPSGGTAGAASSGGTTSSSGGTASSSGGAAPSSGGTTSSSGGSGSPTASDGGQVGGTANEDGGCGCKVARDRDGHASAVAALLGLLALRRRRPRHG